jgi:hypothetical protein
MLAVFPARVSRVALGNEACRDHAVERAVQRSGAHFHCAPRVLFDLLHDVVAVALPAIEGQENMEDRRRKRPEHTPGRFDFTIYY